MEGDSNRSVLRIGTRGSPLALAQSRQTAERLEAAGQAVELVVVRTSGDKLAEVPLAKIGGKGLFIKELEEALLRGEIDAAIHSMKDVPAELPPGFIIGAVAERADERDVLVLADDLEPAGSGVGDGDATLEQMGRGARIGTGSLRRRAQIAARRRDVETVAIRGNVDTRLEKLRRGDVDAVVLAAAGVGRLGLSIVTRPLATGRFLPSPGPGALAIECRADDPSTAARLAAIHHAPTARACAAERAFTRELQASCVVPVAAHGTTLGGDRIHLDGLVASLDGSRILRAQGEGEAEEVGVEIARRLIGQGARELLDEVERQMAEDGV